MREAIYQAITAERQRQDEKWGPGHDPGDWVMLAVLGEEVGEVSRAMIDCWPQPYDNAALKAELVQVAAVCVRWIELMG